MLKKLYLSQKQNEFIALLKYYGLYEEQPIYKIICPFHADKNASMQINLEKAFFYCYGCGCKGSTFELFKLKQKGNKENNILLRIKLNKLLNRLNNNIYNIYNIYNNKRKYIKEKKSIEGFESESYISVESKLNYKQGIKLSRNYFYNLPDPNWFKPSLNQTIEDETRECLNYMKARGYTAMLLKKFDAKPSLNKYYPICFPLLENGLFRGYVMRTFNTEIEQQRKYLYNKGFQRKLVLPGTYESGKPIVLVEGYLDFLKAKQIGIKNCAAILGWKISHEQIEKLKKYKISKIICGLDNDEAGNKGYNYLKLLCKKGVIASVERLRYPKGLKDMGDIQRNTKQAEKILNQISYLQTE